MSATVSREVSMKSFKLAQRIRLARAEVRHKISSDLERFNIAETTIRNPPVCCKTWRVVDCLRCVRGVKTFRAMKVCARANVGEGRRLGDLTDRERTALVTELRAV